MAIAKILALLLLAPFLGFCQLAELRGSIADPQRKSVAGATIHLSRGAAEIARIKSNGDGRFTFANVAAGIYTLRAEAHGFAAISRPVVVRPTQNEEANLQFERIADQKETIVITAKSLEPAIDLRNSEVFNRTLFTRDDQVLQQLSAGINAGQHEGGGKSLEIRRFGFNLDHGGVNGGLKILVDDVQQNQGTQGHGQGYFGSLKALSPELIQDVTIINDPFSPEYGDFSGLGVVHIRQRESLPDEYTIRIQGGNFDTGRGFLAWSPAAQKTDAYVAYEGSYTDGPLQNALQYRRDNVNANYTRSLGGDQKLGFRFLFGRNNFYSSGQVPLDLVNSGVLDRFG